MKPTNHSCTVPDCGRDAIARGWCGGHYDRWRRTRDIRAHVPLASRNGDDHMVPIEIDASVRALREAGVPPGDNRVRDVLGQLLREGWTLLNAARALGYPLRGITHIRRTDPRYDAALVAASNGRLRPLTRPECPGDACSSSTGYTYGCRKTACVAAKTAQVIAARERAKALTR